MVHGVARVGHDGVTSSFLPSVSALAVCTMGISARTLVLIQEEAGHRMVVPHHLLHWAETWRQWWGGASSRQRGRAAFCLDTALTCC